MITAKELDSMSEEEARQIGGLVKQIHSAYNIYKKTKQLPSGQHWQPTAPISKEVMNDGF